jgi:hypothetical protein
LNKKMTHIVCIGEKGGIAWEVNGTGGRHEQKEFVGDGVFVVLGARPPN